MRESATREELEELLGDIDSFTVSRILETGASFDEVAEALAELENPEAAAHWPQPPIVDDIREILLSALYVEDHPEEAVGATAW